MEQEVLVGFYTDGEMFYDGADYANSSFQCIINAQSIISQTQISKADGSSYILDGSKLDITTCGISELNDFISDTAFRLCQNFPDFEQQYRSRMAQVIQEQSEILVTDPNNVDAVNKLAFSDRAYCEMMCNILRSHDYDQLTDEMKEFLSFFEAQNDYYQKSDIQLIMASKFGRFSEENEKAVEDVRNAKIKVIDLNPNISIENKDTIKAEINNVYDKELYNIGISVDFNEAIEADYKSLRELDLNSEAYQLKSIEICNKQLDWINKRTDLSEEAKIEMLTNVSLSVWSYKSALSDIKRKEEEWNNMAWYEKGWEHSKAFIGGTVEQCGNIFEAGYDTVLVCTGNTELAGVDVSASFSNNLDDYWNINSVAATGPARIAGNFAADVLFVVAVSGAMPGGVGGVMGTASVFGVKGFGTAAEQVAAAGGTDAQIWGAGLINGVIEGGSSALLYGVGKNGQAVLKNLCGSSGKQLAAKVGIGVTKEFAKEGISMINPGDGEFNWEKFAKNATTAAFVEVTHFALTEYTKPFINRLRLKFNGKNLNEASDDLANSKSELKSSENDIRELSQARRYNKPYNKRSSKFNISDENSPFLADDGAYSLADDGVHILTKGEYKTLMKQAKDNLSKWKETVKDKTTIFNNATRRDPFEFFNNYSFRVIKKYEKEAYNEIVDN